MVSSINPNDALSLIIPSATEYRKVLVQCVDKKFRKDLTLANVKNIAETHNVETSQRLGKNMKK